MRSVVYPCTLYGNSPDRTLHSCSFVGRSYTSHPLPLAILVSVMEVDVVMEIGAGIEVVMEIGAWNKVDRMSFGYKICHVTFNQQFVIRSRKFPVADCAEGRKVFNIKCLTVSPCTAQVESRHCNTRTQ